MPQCRMRHCKTHGRHGISMFRFPYKTDRPTAEKWLVACGIEFDCLRTYNFKDKFICAKHFTDSDFRRDMFAELMSTEKRRAPKLKDEAVPTVDLPPHKMTLTVNKPRKSASIDRSVRMTKKRVKLEEMQLKDAIMLRPFMCSCCEAMFSSFDKFSKHMRRHKKRYRTKDCKKKYLNCDEGQDYNINEVFLECIPVQETSGLQGHIETPSKVTNFQCELCKKYFAKNSSLKRHARTHTKEKPYQCETCLKSFSQNGHLTEHIRTHTKEKPFQCEYCQKYFSRSTGLKKHIRTHSSSREELYQCEYCQKSYTQSTHLKYHIRTHTGEDLYQCEFCQKTFPIRSHLIEHIKRHTQDRSYQCEYCGKCFVTTGALRIHIRTHTKEKPYQCQFCQKCFAQSAHLRDHIRTHTKEKPYQCDYCQKCYRQSGDLKKHFRTHFK